MNITRGPGRWKSEDASRTDTGTSIRGKTISGPIPFPDDDEFPLRGHGTGISIPLATEDVDKQLEQLGGPAVTEPHSTAQPDEKDSFADSKSVELSEEHPQQTYDPPVPPTEEPNGERIPTPSVPPHSGLERTKRKKSSFRAVFGRLFKRKTKENPSPGQYTQDTRDERAEQHRSDPTPLNSISKNASPSQQRSVSMPINELNIALQSPSTGTEDFQSPPTLNTNRNSIIQVDGQAKPRRATLSGIWTPNRTPGYADWTGLSPRPASSHAKGSKVAIDDEPKATIGIAVTSGSHPHRKSRSAGELRGITLPTFIERDRTDEIKYWRQGDHALVIPPVPSNKDEAVKSILINEEDTMQYEEPEPSQRFDFGPMVEMVGMKTTQNLTLEDRVLKLEDRVSELEKVIFRSSSHQVTEQLMDQDLAQRSLMGEPSPSVSRPRTSNSELSLPKQSRSREIQQLQSSQGPTSLGGGKQTTYDSRRPSTISTNTSYQPSFDNDHAQQFLTPQEQKPIIPSHQHTVRPLSNSTTIRGISSTPPNSSNDGKPINEDYTALLNMILAERAARQELETVVLKLQQRLQTMAWTSYPVPASNLTKPLGEVRDDGQLLDLEQDDSSLDDGQYASDDFRTPNEDTGLFGDEIFGEISHDKAGSKTAPRVVSLSQMTLRRGAQPGLGF